MIGKTLWRRRTSSVSSARIEPLEPRRLLAAAMDSPAQFLGDVSAGYHRQIAQNVPARRTDSWGFNITQPVAMTLLADRLKHDGDLILQQTNSKGRVRTVARSNNPGRSAERIELTLEPGRYNILLSNQANKTNSYRLTARTAEVAAPSFVQATVWSGNEAQVRWKDNSHNETGFRVQQWIRGRWKNVAEANRNATAAVVSGHLQPGHEPQFRVVARRGQAAIASTNTMSVTMTGSDESGWYRVTGLTYKGKGEAGWSARSVTLGIDDTGWIHAGSWQSAVESALSGGITLDVTFDYAGYTKGQTATHTIGGSNAFTFGTAAEVRQIGLNSARGASAIPDEPNQKVIAVEDSYGGDADYDDWWWEVETEFVRLEALTASGTHEGTAKSATASDGTTGSLTVTANEEGKAEIRLGAVLVLQPPGADVACWKLTTEDSGLVASGTLDGDGKGGTVTVDITTKKFRYVLSAGVDADGDGHLGREETHRSIRIDVESTWEVAYPEVFEKLAQIFDPQAATGARLSDAKADLQALLGATILVERAYAAANAANASKSLWGLIWDASSDIPAITAVTVGMALQVPALTNVYQNSVIIQKGVQGMRGLSAGTKLAINIASRVSVYGVIAQFAISQGFNVYKVRHIAEITDALGALVVGLRNLGDAIDARFQDLDGSFASYAAKNEELLGKKFTHADVKEAESLIRSLDADWIVIRDLLRRDNDWIDGITNNFAQLEANLIGLIKP